MKTFTFNLTPKNENSYFTYDKIEVEAETIEAAKEKLTIDQRSRIDHTTLGKRY